MTGHVDKPGEERNRGREFRFRNSFESKGWDRNWRTVRRILMWHIIKMKLAQCRAVTGSYVSSVGVFCQYLCHSFTVGRFNDVT